MKKEITQVELLTGLFDTEESKMVIRNTGETMQIKINGQPGIVMNDFMFLQAIALFMNQPKERVYGVKAEEPTEYFVKNPMIVEES